MNNEDEVAEVVDAVLRDLEAMKSYENNRTERTAYKTYGSTTYFIEAPRKRWWNMNFKSRNDRMWTAFCAAAIFAVAVPVVVGVFLVLTTGLLYSFGVSGYWIRHHVWGWLSDFNFYKEYGKTHEAMTPKLFPLTYFTSVVVVYVVYLFAEGCVRIGEEYAELARGRKISHHDSGRID